MEYKGACKEMEKSAAIFQPIRLGNVEIKNRIEVAPAAPFLTGHGGAVTPEFYAYTTNLAKSGAGIVTIGVTNVDQSAPGGGSAAYRRRAGSAGRQGGLRPCDHP